MKKTYRFVPAAEKKMHGDEEEACHCPLGSAVQQRRSVTCSVSTTPARPRWKQVDHGICENVTVAEVQTACGVHGRPAGLAHGSVSAGPVGL